MIDHNEAPLRWFLRIVGTASLLALPCALMPLPWMDAIHQHLGLGPLPSGPVVAYLARSTSLFYALLGGLLWLVSFDLPRHRWVIVYLGAAMVVLGCCLLWIDISAGLPRWWAWYEGPWDALLGGIILWLNRRMTESLPSCTQRTMQFEHGTAIGLSHRWHRGQYCTILTRAGLIGCGIFDLVTPAEFGQAIAIAKGTTTRPLAEPEDLLDAPIVGVTPKATSYGIRVGMTGREAVELMLQADIQEN